ncbi:MAG: glycosyltransferase family 4 protein [Halobacteriota archaeon]
MERKVIQVGTNSLSIMFPDLICDHYVADDAPYRGGWNATLAAYLKRASDEFTFECWIIEKKAKKPLRWEREGVTYRLFPATWLRHVGEYSKALLHEAKRESQRQTLFTVHGIFNYTAFLLPVVATHAPIVVQHHGDRDARLHARQSEDLGKKIGYAALYAARGEWPFERVSLPRIDRFFTLTREVEEYLSHFVEPGKIQRLSMGVDFDMFTHIDQAKARKILDLNPAKRYVLYVGSMLPIKGIDYLIRAFPSILKECPNAVLILVGAGSYRTKLIELIKQFKIEGSVMTVPENGTGGYLDQRVLPLYYNAADVLVLPSLYEGLGLVQLEALACGTPIVATRSTEVIERFGGGIIVPARNVEALSHAVMRVLGARHAWIADRMGARRQYDWKYITQKHLDLYATLFTKHYG